MDNENKKRYDGDTDAQAARLGFLSNWRGGTMSKRTRTTLLVVDLLTIILVIIHIQSAIVAYIHYSNLPSWPGNLITESVKKYVYYGWADVLHAQFGSFIKWLKIVLFFANIYAVIKKLILIFKKMIDLRLALLVLLNLLFIGLKVLEALWVWEMWMSV